MNIVEVSRRQEQKMGSGDYAMVRTVNSTDRVNSIDRVMANMAWRLDMGRTDWAARAGTLGNDRDSWPLARSCYQSRLDRRWAACRLVLAP